MIIRNQFRGLVQTTAFQSGRGAARKPLHEFEKYTNVSIHPIPPSRKTLQIDKYTRFSAHVRLQHRLPVSDQLLFKPVSAASGELTVHTTTRHSSNLLFQYGIDPKSSRINPARSALIPQGDGQTHRPKIRLLHVSLFLFSSCEICVNTL